MLLCSWKIIKCKNPSIFRRQRFLPKHEFGQPYGSETTIQDGSIHQRQEHTLGSHVEVLNDLTPLYLANRFRAATSIGVSTSSGNSG